MKTIFVADDKASERDLVREYLEAEGFRVVIAADGRGERDRQRPR
jgi:CheY-like chemotaxis protein